MLINSYLKCFENLDIFYVMLYILIIEVKNMATIRKALNSFVKALTDYATLRYNHN